MLAVQTVHGLSSSASPGVGSTVHAHVRSLRGNSLTGNSSSAGSASGIIVGMSHQSRMALGLSAAVGISALCRQRSQPSSRARSDRSKSESAENSLRSSSIPDSDPESLRWALELAVMEENYELAARLQKAIPAAEEARPLRALQGLARQHAREAVDDVLADGADMSAQARGIEVLQTLATPPAALSEAEEGLHRVMLHGDEEIVDMAEAALWAVWSASGEDHVDELMGTGLNLMGEGELSKAIEVFSKVVQAAPGFAEGWNKRATALFLANKFDESIEDCKRVLDLKPKHFGCLSGLGICYLRKGDQALGERWLRAALEVNPRIRDVSRIVTDLEAQSVSAVLKPRIMEVMEQFNTGSWPDSDGGREKHIQTTWDAHRVQDVEKCTYFFRVRIECSDQYKGPNVAGAARYYVLKDSNGHVFQLSRLTPTLTPSSFKLHPGRSYAYSFMVTLDEDLQAVQGGVMAMSDDEIYDIGLKRLYLQDAPDMRERDFLRLNVGYDFVGRVEVSNGK